MPLCILSAFPYSAQAEKQRVFVLTDISNEPDDEESMVRFLVYANEYDIEGLVATTSTHLRNRTREDQIRRQVDAYSQVRGSLALHADGYPTSDQLLAVTATGQPSYGMEATGDGKASAGSKLLVAAADKDDKRPLWISVWGSANTLAQALWDARRDRSPEELAQLVAKLRVYTISDQDDAGRWLRLEFPDLSSTGSSDPDGDAINCRWMVYREAGTYSGHVELTRKSGEKAELTVPNVRGRSQTESTIHVILTVEDDGAPSLVAYRRAIVTIQP